MRDFAESLDDRLRALAAYAEPVSRLSVVPPFDDRPARPDGAGASPARQPTRRFALRRPVFSGGMIAAIGAAATAIVLTGSATAALPIFETESSDASALRADSTLAAADVNFDEGYPFNTPDGSAWVVTSRDGRKVCITLPNRRDPGSYGVACASRTTVEQRGLSIQLVSDRAYDAQAKNRVAFVLPVGASSVTLTTGGRTIALQTKTGVAVAWLTGPGTFAYRRNGRVERQSFLGPFHGSTFICNGVPNRTRSHKPGPKPEAGC